MKSLTNEPLGLRLQVWREFDHKKREQYLFLPQQILANYSPDMNKQKSLVIYGKFAYYYTRSLFARFKTKALKFGGILTLDKYIITYIHKGKARLRHNTYMNTCIYTIYIYIEYIMLMCMCWSTVVYI